MKKKLATALLIVGVCGHTLVADGLKSVLSQKLNHPDTTPGMVNIDAIHAPAKRTVVPRTRSSKAVVAIVDGRKIRKKEADRYLSKRTKGKVKNFDLLPKAQRLALIKEMVLPQIVASRANKALNPQEKEKVLSGAWMAKSIDNTNVSEEELKRAYDTILAQSQASTPLQQIPPFEKIKERLRRQIAQQKVIEALMQGVAVRLAQQEGDVAGYVGMLPVDVKEANEAIAMMTHTQKQWQELSSQEKVQLLQMMAPAKLVALSAKNDLSDEEKRNALSNYWIQQNLPKVDVSEKEIKKRYRLLKKRVSKKEKLPSYDTLKESLKMQIANEKFMDNVVKTAKIKLI